MNNLDQYLLDQGCTEVEIKTYYKNMMLLPVERLHQIRAWDHEYVATLPKWRVVYSVERGREYAKAVELLGGGMEKEAAEIKAQVFNAAQKDYDPADTLRAFVALQEEANNPSLAILRAFKELI